MFRNRGVSTAFVRTLALATILLSGSCIMSAQADTIFFRSQPVQIIDRPVVKTIPVIVPSTTFVAPSTSTVQTVTQSAVIVPTTESAITDRTLTNEYLFLSPSIGTMSNFRRRLDNISEQISLGESRGWLSADAAGIFQGEYRVLATEADNVMARGGGTRDENSFLEQQINLLNQKVSSAMATSGAM